MKKYLYLLLILSMSLIACERGVVDPISVPTIRIDELSPANVKQFEDRVRLVISYEDADGDIGTEDPDVTSLWVKDSRLENGDEYHVRPITLPGDEVIVRGSFGVDLGTFFLLGNGNSEQLSFSVKLQDRAGNWSEEVKSSTITIVK